MSRKLAKSISEIRNEIRNIKESQAHQSEEFDDVLKKILGVANLTLEVCSQGMAMINNTERAQIAAGDESFSAYIDDFLRRNLVLSQGARIDWLLLKELLQRDKSLIYLSRSRKLFIQEFKKLGYPVRLHDNAKAYLLGFRMPTEEDKERKGDAEYYDADY